MFFGCVVHNKIQTHADISPMAFFRQILQVFHRTQAALYFCKIRHGIPAVIVYLGRVQKRHQMEAAHAALLNVIQLLFNPFQSARKRIRVHHHAHHVVSFIPVRVLFSFFVQPLQLCVTFPAALLHHPA